MWYMFGVGLGTLAVFFIFGDREIQCSYFPNDRVLYDLRKKEIHITSEVQQVLDSRKIDTSEVSMMLLSGEVDFDKSKTEVEDTCKTYWINYKPVEGRDFSAEWMNCDSIAYLLHLE